MISRLFVVLAVFICLLVGTVPAISDNVSPLSSDPQEHYAQMELAAAERFLHYKFQPIAIQKLQTLLANRPNWELVPQVELDLAHALMLTKQPEECITECERLRDTYHQSKPLLAAWAQFYIGRGNERMKQYAEAVQAYRAVETFSDEIADLLPLLAAQRKIANLIRNKKLDKSQALNLSSSDINEQAWSSTVMMAMYAERGKLQEAYQEYEKIKALLPHGDHRIALAGVRLSASELYVYERRKVKEPAILAHAKQILQELEFDYPNETWLLTKCKLNVAMIMVCRRDDVSDAENYLKDIVANGSDEDRLPAAYSLLAEALYAQHKYNEAATTAQIVEDRYPYSTWADFASYTRALCLYEAGKKTEALVQLDKVVQLYPDSTWAQAAKVMKEVSWK